MSADGLLLVHALFVIFVVFGLALVLVGKALGWHWIRNPWFRWAHLIAISFVVVQTWLNQVCPLTTWEMSLREKAGETVYSGTFISHWVSKLLYHSAPDWVFALVYTAFGTLVFVAWFWAPPRPLRRSGKRGNSHRADVSNVHRTSSR